MYTSNTPRALFTALVFSLLSTASLVAQDCTHPDYSSLEKLYIATEGDDWSNNNGWLTNCEPCTWTGIGCDGNNRVTSIILRGNGLKGTLPTEIGDFDHLRLINLAYNEVSGELPASLFTIASLRDINFSGNQFSGTLPSTVGEEPLLENLRLNNNLLTGPLSDELSSFTQMKILTLNDNGFTGAVPEGFGDLPFLFNLDLGRNNLAGCFPSDLENLCGNTRMRFGGNVELSWSGDFSSFCANGFDVDQTGAPCDDGNPLTISDEITADCGCDGVIEFNGVVQNEQEIIETLHDVVEVPDAAFITPSGLAPDQPTQPTNRLTVFPNPVVGTNVSIRLPEGVENAELRLLSLTGRVITQKSMNGPATEMTLSGLSSGVYMLEAIAKGDRSVQRIVIQ